MTFFQSNERLAALRRYSKYDLYFVLTEALHHDKDVFCNISPRDAMAFHEDVADLEEIYVEVHSIMRKLFETHRLDVDELLDALNHADIDTKMLVQDFFVRYFRRLRTFF
jgi:predicted RNA-binding protein associated with RNAse of E/G family